MFGHAVSVGGDCQPAHQLRRITGHDEAHVFDWLLLRADSVARLIEHDFDGWLASDDALSLQTQPYAHVRDARYGVHLLHDFPLVPDFLAHANAVRAKYRFLLQRWHLLMASEAAVLFVWKGDEGREAVAAIAAALRRARQGRRFHLLALRTDVKEEDWALADVSNRFLPPSGPDDWTGDDAAWDAQLGVGST